MLALTDHDTTDGIAAAEAAVPAGMTLVAGAEISCPTNVHLLAYLFDPADPRLAAELRLLRADRDRRAREMVERARAHGAPVTWESVSAIAGGAPVGRPHVANALVSAGVTDYAGAFRDWIGHDGPAYVPKRAPDPVEAVRLVVAAGGVSAVAHPGGRKGVSDELLADMAAAGMRGIEVDHPEHDAVTRARLRSLAADLGLVATAGSDYHGSRKATVLGAESATPAAYDALVAGASGAAPVRG